MSHIVPYISTDPPSLHEDSLEKESITSDKITDVIEYSKRDDSSSILNEDNISLNDMFDNDGLSGVELRQYVDKIIKDNHLQLDCTDSTIKKNNDDDFISECSFEGQFDEYIDKVNNICTSNNIEIMECEGIIDQNKSYFHNTFDSAVNEEINDMKQCDYNFGDFGTFSQAVEASDYFTEKKSLSASLAFADFQLHSAVVDDNDYPCVNDQQEIDDDFDDFATFEDSSDHASLSQETQLNTNLSEKTVEDIVQSFHQELLSSINSIDTGNASSGVEENDCCISPNNYLANDCSMQIWKELTNFDYSPAFIFQWMQSISFENFMTSIGPDYKELLSSQRVTLPLYSVNLMPIEPVVVDNFVQNIHSTTSSSLDLSIHEKVGNVTLDKSSNVDIKNLGDEFLFNTNINDDGCISNTKFDNRSSMPNLSSAVIQSEGFGGILKSMLKPLNSGKSSTPIKPLNHKTEAVLKDLPDLSYMTSKVLMFPVLASYDVQDNV